jgi:hypothetical protein
VNARFQELSGQYVSQMWVNLDMNGQSPDVVSYGGRLWRLIGRDVCAVVYVPATHSFL